MAAGLAGCADVLSGGGGGGGGSGTVKWGFDPTAVENNGDKIKQLFYDNGLSQDIDIQWVPGNQETGKRRDKYAQLLGAGETTPDLFLMDNGWVNIFIQNGDIMNLSQSGAIEDSVVQRVNNDYFEGFTATARDPNSGDLYGVPVFPDFPTMQYRKSWVEEAGYDPEGNNWATEPMTWAEWSKIVKGTMDAVDPDFGFVTQWDIYVGTACCNFNEMMTSYGGAYFGGRENLFGPVGDRPVTVDKEPVVRTLDVMRKFVHGDDSDLLQQDYAGNIAPTEILSWTEEDARKAHLNGRAAFQRNWPYAYALNGTEENLGKDLGGMPLPYGVTESNAMAQGTGGSSAALGGWHTTMNPNSQKKEAAAEVLKVLTDDAVSLGMLELQGWLPPKPALFESQKAQDVPTVGRYMDTLKVAGQGAIARPVTQVWTEQITPIATQANAAVAKKRSSQKAMNQLKSQLQKIENQ